MSSSRFVSIASTNFPPPASAFADRRTFSENGAAPPVRVLAIPGSLRRESWNRRLLEVVRELAPAGVEIELFDLAGVPFYDGDVEAAGDPPAVRALKERIRAADAVLIATPEYNATPPGVLLNAIDWASRPRGGAALDGKPVAVVGASPGGGGTARAQAVLRQTLRNAGAALPTLSEALVSGVAGRFGGDGLRPDAALTEALRELLAALVAAAHVGGGVRVA